VTRLCRNRVLQRNDRVQAVEEGEVRYSQVEGRRGALVARRSSDAQKDVTGRGLDFVAAQHDAFCEWWKSVRAPVVSYFWLVVDRMMNVEGRCLRIC
jgi:hypothetical protein